MEIILLIEDDAALGSQVKQNLEAAGFEVVWWRKGRLVSESDLVDIVLVVLDLMLPGVLGLEVLKHLRSTSEVPVLVLSAKQDSRDKVHALKLGADDYLSKPFWPEELVERVRARLRRPALQRSSELRVGELTIDPQKRVARYLGESLELTKVEFDLLAAFARRAGQPVPRAWLLAHVLDPDREATDRTLDVHVSRLRKKLKNADLIETVWGIGYRLTGGAR